MRTRGNRPWILQFYDEFQYWGFVLWRLKATVSGDGGATGGVFVLCGDEPDSLLRALKSATCLRTCKGDCLSAIVL